MNDSDNELQEQAAALLDGKDVTWIERVRRTGFLRGLDLLALILYVNRDTRDLAGSSKIIIEHWSILITKSIEAGHITARYPASFLPMETKSINGWGWALSLDQADRLFARAGMAWTCSDIVEQLFNNYVKEGSSPKQDENSELRRELGALKKKLDSAGEIITGFAISKYNFDPSAEKNMALSKMLIDLEAAHFPQDHKTLSQFLKRKFPPKN